MLSICFEWFLVIRRTLK